MNKKLPDVYWFWFSENVDDWHKMNEQRDRDRWNRIYKDKKERKILRNPNRYDRTEGNKLSKTSN